MSQSFSAASPIARAIRSIRNRLGKTGVEFARLLGINQAMVSRYERGTSLPGYVILGRLLELAEGTEKNAILDRVRHLLERAELTEQAALKELRATDRWRPIDPTEGLKARGWRVLSEEPMQILRSAPPELGDFALLAGDIVRRGKAVDRALIEVLALWLRYDTTDDQVRRYFADAAKFLEVSLATWKAKQEERDPGSSHG